MDNSLISKIIKDILYKNPGTSSQIISDYIDKKSKSINVYLNKKLKERKIVPLTISCWIFNSDDNIYLKMFNDRYLIFKCNKYNAFEFIEELENNYDNILKVVDKQIENISLDKNIYDDIMKEVEKKLLNNKIILEKDKLKLTYRKKKYALQITVEYIEKLFTKEIPYKKNNTANHIYKEIINDIKNLIPDVLRRKLYVSSAREQIFFINYCYEKENRYLLGYIKKEKLSPKAADYFTAKQMAEKFT